MILDIRAPRGWQTELLENWAPEGCRGRARRRCATADRRVGGCGGRTLGRRIGLAS